MDKIVFIDTETTGLKPHKGHRVIEIACIEYQNGKKTGRQFNTRLNAEGKSSDKGALKTHGISDSSLIQEPLFKDVINDFIEIVKDAHVIAYNAAFDMSFINNELLRAGYPSTIFDIASKVSCAMEMATQKFGLQRKVKLDAACKRYQIDISNRQIHNALLDAQLCAEVYFKLIDDSEVPLSRTPQSNKHKETKAISLPKAFKPKKTNETVQVNFCKNSECANFGKPAKNPVYKNYKTKELKRGLGNDYKLTLAKDGTNQLTCKLCGQSTTLVHNRCFTLEADRVKAIGNQIEPSCTRRSCKNHGVGIFSSPEQYSLEGQTRPTRTWAHVSPSKARDKHGKPLKDITFIEMHGSKRILCKGCNKRFSVKLDPQQRHYLREHNEAIFKRLMNKGIINRIAEEFEISNKVIYGKIDFLYEQALAFDKFHSYFLPKALEGKSLNLSSDRQHYLSNWGDHNMPMPTPIINTTTACNDTGYVFASTINFDFTSDAAYIKKEHSEKKENLKERHFQRYAQYLLDDDEINAQDNGGIIDLPMQAPPKGLLVHQTYSILAHFKQMRRMLEPCEHVNLFADNDSGFKLAICGIFKDWIANHKLSAFQLFVERSGGQNLLDKSTSVLLQQRLKELEADNPNVDATELKKMLWSEHFSNRVRINNSRSEWMVNPNHYSRYDGILPLTNINEMELEEALASLESVSLNGVDNFFQVLRRHVNMLERPVTSGTNGRRWNAYAGYNPEWMTKLVEIKRVYFNYCMTDERTNRAKLKASEVPEPTTPAMRLGLVSKVFDAQDILSFSSTRNFIESELRKKSA